MAKPSRNASGVTARRARPLRWGFWVFQVALVATVLSSVVIWPGAATLTAPLFCHASDVGGSYTPMVVADTQHFGGRTSTNYTLYCVGPHGELLDAGFARPMLVIFAAALVVLIVLATVLRLGRHAWRRRTPAQAGNELELPYR